MLESGLQRHLWGQIPTGKTPPWSRTPIYAYQRVSSTMEIAAALIESNAPEGTLVWAASQTQGRGRLGREWKSPRGGVYCSLILRPNCEPTETPELALVAGLSTAQAIEHLTGSFPSIRWPNDILFNNRKVAGILSQLKGKAVVVGIGINVNTLPEDLPPEAVSLAALGAGDCDPFRLTAELCWRFEGWYDGWMKEGFGPIREALRPWMGGFGQPVQISTMSEQFRGTATDLDEAGHLIVRLDSGLLRAFDVGEVTLLR